MLFLCLLFGESCHATSHHFCADEIVRDTTSHFLPDFKPFRNGTRMYTRSVEVSVLIRL